MVLSNYNQHAERRRRRAGAVDPVVGGRGPLGLLAYAWRKRK